ncbi:MAG: cupredoxin domain-containing protein, partial [Acidobacteria bacterium]|nr:cupredoxin domain-containing protein [Acidobacteriota bacterium]
IIAWIVWYFWLWKEEAVSAQAKAEGVLEVDVTVKGGYQPSAIMVKAGQPVRLNFTRREASTCGEEVVLPDFGRRAHLPENQTVSIEVTPAKPGEYEFTCGMNMMRGKLIAQ